MFTFVQEKKYIKKGDGRAERTNMSISSIMRLLDFVLNHHYFKHDVTDYKQFFGCAMGSPISPVKADLVMEEVDELRN